METPELDCEDCEGRGWSFFETVGKSGGDCFEIERCDTCKRFESDADAQQAATIDDKTAIGLIVDTLNSQISMAQALFQIREHVARVGHKLEIP